jgi:Holliday junction resolvase RusA-like endonuclease
MEQRNGRPTKTARRRLASKGTNVESNLVHALSHTFTNEQFTTPVSIAVCSYRTRLVDADGVSVKAVLDGLVHCGLLPDDSAKYVKEVTYSQVKVKNREEEKTVITITEVSHGDHK